MQKFTTLTASACPLGLSDIDTDQLLPARFLKVPRASGLGRYLLHDLRRDAAGKEREDFPLNKTQWRGAPILVAGRNFGGGSSREAAVYALCDAGIRCVIAPSFGDIFSQNATKNGLLTAIVGNEDSAAILSALDADPAPALTVDLERQTIGWSDRTVRFDIDPARRMRLLNGWDDIGLTRAFQNEIAQFRQRDRQARPWSYL